MRLNGRASGRRIVMSYLETRARAFERDVHALFLAARDPRVPWYAKAAALCVAGYALSPIDLIPDVVPVLGYLDDLIIVPLGIMLAVRIIPAELMAEHKRSAAAAAESPGARLGPSRSGLPHSRSRRCGRVGFSQRETSAVPRN